MTILSSANQAQFSFTQHTLSIVAGSLAKEEIVTWAYVPNINPRLAPSPTIVMANGLALPRSAGLPDVASRFAGAGYNVFLFDFRHLGDSTGSPRHLVSVSRQEEDYVSVLRYVSDPSQHESRFGRQKLDPGRVALWGWSNSGGHVCRMAGRSDLPIRLSCVIAIDPLVDGQENVIYQFRQKPGTFLKLLPWILSDLLLSLFTNAIAITIPALGPGGFVGSEEAQRGIRQITPRAGPPCADRIAARFAMDIIHNRARGDAARCPVLLTWAQNEADGLIPSYIPHTFARQARAAGLKVEAYEHAGDHFACQPGGCAFEDAIDRQLQFLAGTLLLNSSDDVKKRNDL